MRIIELHDVGYIRECISDCYGKDNELLDKYHTKKGLGLEVCVQYVVDGFQENPSRFFVFYNNQDVVGFFASSMLNCPEYEVQMLASFFILPKYRKIKTKEAWDLINHFFSYSTFVIGICNYNSPAVGFFSKKCTSSNQWFCEQFNTKATLFIFNGV